MLLLALDGSRLRVTVVCSNVVAIGTQNRTESVIHESQILDAAKQFFALCFEALVIRLVALDTSKQQLVHLPDVQVLSEELLAYFVVHLHLPRQLEKQAHEDVVLHLLLQLQLLMKCCERRLPVALTEHTLAGCYG